MKLIRTIIKLVFLAFFSGLIYTAWLVFKCFQNGANI